MNKRIRKYFSLNYLLLYLVLFVAIFFRFYNAPNKYGFDYDPVRDALVTSYGAENFKFPLIGPPSGIGTFSFGPWYYYQLIFFKIVSSLDYAPWVYIGILSTMSVFIMYQIGKSLSGEKFGFLLAIFAAISPAETGQIRALSNPTLIPIHASLAIWIFLILLKRKFSPWLIAFWGLVFGIGINDHYQLLGLLIFPIILFIYKKENRWKGIAIFLLSLFVTFIPLMLFNFFHDFNALKGIIFYVTQEKNNVYVPNRWLFYIRDFWPSFEAYVLGFTKNFGIPISIYLFLGILYLLLKRRLSKNIIFILIVFIINFLVLRFFSGQREYYYLLYLHPFIFIFFGLVTWEILNSKFKYLGFVILLATFIGMLGQSQMRLGTEQFHMLYENEANELMAKYQNKDFVIYECKNNNKSEIRGILFFLNNKNRVNSDGIKILFPNSKCTIPQAENVQPLSIAETNAFNVSYASNEQLLQNGWRRVTPETIFLDISNGVVE